MKQLNTLKTKPIACLFITCTFKNTLITATKINLEPLFQKSSRGFKTKNKRKNNPYILQQLTSQVALLLRNLKYKKLCIFINGVGAGRYNIVKHLIKRFQIQLIHDRTRLPFNGCRVRKQKRK
jgi:small subunit ribosomal protein S11